MAFDRACIDAIVKGAMKVGHEALGSAEAQSRVNNADRAAVLGAVTGTLVAEAISGPCASELREILSKA